MIGIPRAGESAHLALAGSAGADVSLAHHYVLECCACGMRFLDDGLRTQCSEPHGPSLLATRYADPLLKVDPDETGVFRYRSWLPVRRGLHRSGRTVTYKSESLGRFAGIQELWIGFHGYWPERGCELETGTFKDLEAYTALARFPDDESSVIVVASAGNTAAAFARACSLHGQPCAIIVPETALESLRFSGPLAAAVRIIAIASPADYTDAIELSNRIGTLPGFHREGGVANVARRDGLGTVLLNAAETIGRLPDYYFQAVGSGSGAIGVHEAAQRLVLDGRYGRHVPRHMLSQNLPCAPLHTLWHAADSADLQSRGTKALDRAAEMFAPVLSNRRPPYAITGGVRDVLQATDGDVLAIGNEEARAAGRLFEHLEGCDVEPAGAVAVASLIRAASQGRVDRSSVFLLNITGGGRKRKERDGRLPGVEPALRISLSESRSPAVLDRVSALF